MTFFDSMKPILQRYTRPFMKCLVLSIEFLIGGTIRYICHRGNCLSKFIYCLLNLSAIIPGFIVYMLYLLEAEGDTSIVCCDRNGVIISVMVLVCLVLNLIISGVYIRSHARNPDDHPNIENKWCIDFGNKHGSKLFLIMFLLILVMGFLWYVFRDAYPFSPLGMHLMISHQNNTFCSCGFPSSILGNRSADMKWFDNMNPSCIFQTEEEICPKSNMCRLSLPLIEENNRLGIHVCTIVDALECTRACQQHLDPLITWFTLSLSFMIVFAIFHLVIAGVASCCDFSKDRELDSHIKGEKQFLISDNTVDEDSDASR
jgi:hypothetical protein